VLKIIKENSGVYLLEILASEPFTIELESLNSKILNPGYYYYSGSAQKYLGQRVERHQDENKTIHWNIDHLTTIPTNKIKTIFLFDGASKSLECELISELLQNFRLSIAVKGFGNSDCRRCITHLLYCKKRLTHNHFIERYQSMVRVIPASNEIA
jgi:Uri superfamily endonuclease